MLTSFVGTDATCQEVRAGTLVCLSIDLAPLSAVFTVLFAAFRAQVWASHFAGVAGPGLRAAVATQLRRLFAQVCVCVCVRVYQLIRLLVPG